MSPHFPAKPRAVSVDSRRTSQITALPCWSQQPPFSWGCGGHRVTSGTQCSLEPGSSWSMELHNFYGFLTPGGSSCSCSSIASPLGLTAKGAQGPGGGKFPNKQTLREGLSRARQWKEREFSGFLAKQQGFIVPIPLAQGHGPREAQSRGCRGWVCCIPNQFPRHTGVAVSSSSMIHQGQPRGKTGPRHPGTQG